MTTAATPKAGLEDTVATTSAICYLDGDHGVLAYCGFDIHDLAQHATFEEVCYLLWHRRLPTRSELGDLQSQLAAGRVLPEGVLRLMRSLPGGSGMDMVRTLTSALSHYDPDSADNSPAANYRKAVRLTAQMGSLVATLGRMAKGGGPIEPDPVLGHSANFLYMLTGQRPGGLETRAFDVALVLHADHELNASTFAARVAAATLTDIHSSIVAAVGTLKGPLHGGANEEAWKVLEQVGEPGRAEGWIKDALARKERIMGFGHRVYKTGDPRARILKDYCAALAKEVGDDRWERIAEPIERAVVGQKGLPPNVDWPSARLYHYMGLPLRLYTPIFAMARVAGWAAHIIEQLDHNRLMRPRATYTGPPNRPVRPIEQRG